jgi:UDP-2,3-diacylglucosamine pyrophosphatase LpxH
MIARALGFEQSCAFFYFVEKEIAWMRSDFDLIVHEICDKEIKIYPIADVHFGALEHDTQAWAKFISKVASEADSYIILAGDLINNNTRSSVGSPWDDRIRPREQKRLMVEFLSPLRDKILCCVSGNHERRSLKDADDDPTYDIMTKLDLEDIYRQNAAFMKIRLGARTRNGGVGYDTSFKFAVTHGSGGGMTGAAVNRNERWGNVIDGVDCVIAGHTHKGAITRPSKIVIDEINDMVTIKDYVVLSCVSWQNFGAYPLQQMMQPTTVARPQSIRLISRPKEIELVW